MPKHISHFAKTMLVSLLLILPAGVHAQSSDCDANAMIWCGVSSTSDLQQKLQQGDGHHSAANLQKQFAATGASASTIKNAHFVNGTVTKTGKVIVNGKVVATGAVSYGRQFMPGSTKVGSLYRRPTSISFQSDSLPALVAMGQNGFRFAIIKSCGNVVRATPVAAVKTVTKTVIVSQPAVVATTVTAPAPLPQTGSMAIGGALGLTAIGMGLWYLRQSRRQLKISLLNS